MIIEFAQRETLSETLAHSLFTDRSAQFIDRLGWNLCATPEGLEVDEYDETGDSTYILVSNGKQHLGSCRVRPVAQGTMIEDHFSDIFPDAKGFLNRQRNSLFELTRFCRSPEIGVVESREMLRYLAVALDRFRDEAEVAGYVAVVFEPITRFLKRIGVRFLTLADGEIGGRKVHLICITHAIEPKRTVGQYDHLLEKIEAEPVKQAA